MAEETEGTDCDNANTQKPNCLSLLNECDAELLIAYPPDDATKTDSTFEVSNSPAFQCLDELFGQGKLTGTQVVQMKARYMELYDCLKRSRENEFQMLQQSKRFMAELEVQDNEMAKVDDFPDLQTETGRLREALLQACNTLALTEARLDELSYMNSLLKEEKKMIQREYTRFPIAELESVPEGVDVIKEMSSKLKSLEMAYKELRLEIQVQLRERKKLQDNLRNAEEQVKSVMKESEDANGVVETLKMDLIAVSQLPSQYSKETEKLRRFKIEAEKELQALEEENVEVNKQIESLEKEKMKIVEETAEWELKVSNMQAELSQTEEKLDVYKKETLVQKEKEFSLKAERAGLDNTNRHLCQKKRKLQETICRCTRDRDQYLRTLKKNQLQLKVSEEGVLVAKLIFDKAKARFENFPRDDTLLEKKVKLENQAAEIKEKTEAQGVLAAKEQMQIHNSLRTSERLLKTLSKLQCEVMELMLLASNKSEERQQRAHELTRTEMRYQRSVEDLDAKEMQIIELQKKTGEMKTKLDDFAKQYEVVKAKRNKAVSLVQETSQKAAEFREKIKMCANEVDISRTSVSDLEHLIQRERMRFSESMVVRDSIRYEICKQAHIEKDQHLKREGLKMDIQRLNVMVNMAEEDMVSLRKHSDRAVQQRNESAMRLIERNEEVYILQEKTSVQEKMMRHAEFELQGRLEEITCLERHLLEERRSLELLKKRVPNKHELENQLLNLTIQLSICEDNLLEFEAAAEDPTAPGRVRLLQGYDPPPEEMQNRMIKLEARLTDTEERLLEKDLLYEAVSRLVDHIQRKAMMGRDDSLKLAKEVNSYKSRLLGITKRMKALTAELSIHFARGLDLKDAVQAKKTRLKENILRLEKGEPPNIIVGAEWKEREKTEFEIIRKRLRQQAVDKQLTVHPSKNNNATGRSNRSSTSSNNDSVFLPVIQTVSSQQKTMTRPVKINLQFLPPNI